MKLESAESGLSGKNPHSSKWWGSIIAIALFASGVHAIATFPGLPGDPGPDRTLAVWLFSDTNWLNTAGRGPIAFTNIANVNAGSSYDLEVDSTNAAFLRYHVNESDGSTNLVVDRGSVLFWFKPNWSSTNGGAGPGVFGRLIEVGSYTTNASYGWMSLFLDQYGTNLYFSAQTNGAGTNYFTMPISWESNVWHLIAFTYSSSNSSLYLDGVWATNGPGVSYRPGPSVLTNGFFIGSDSNGLAQAHGQFDDLYTYNYELAQDDLASVYILNGIFYGKAIMGFGSSAPSNPSTNSTGNGFYAVTGPGWLQYVNHASSCASNANLYITNVSCSLGTNGLVTTTFEIQGGSNNVPYDVFGTTALTGNNITNAQWAWLGQGTNCTIYRLPNQPGIGAFYVLGTPKDSDSDGLTDAYEALVSKSDIHKATTGEDGMLDGWAVIFGLDPRANNSTQPSLRSNFAFDPSPQLKQVRGIRQETFGFDGEGNVKLDQ